MIFLFNATDTEKTVRIEEQGYLVDGVGKFENGILTIPSRATTIFVVKIDEKK